MTDHAGRIYVGSLRSSALEMGERTPGDVWRIERDGQKTRIYDQVSFANGIGFSPDERTLYQSNYDERVILAHSLADDGQWVNRRVFASVPRGNPDGLAVDERGQVWVALASGGALACFRPDGQLTQILDVPATFVASLCFGGDDQRDLSIATAGNTLFPERGGALFRTRSDVPGLIAPEASV
jgi:gluconolactonase